MNRFDLPDPRPDRAPQSLRDACDLGLEELRQTREMLTQIGSVCEDAQVRASAGFRGLHRSIGAQGTVLESVLELLQEDSDSDDHKGIDLNKLAHDTDEIMQIFVDHIVRVSAQSMELTHQLSDTVEHMNEAVKHVGGVQKIARQVELLAVNAHIEAVHAGDAGHGFRVVAQEVKRLSDDSHDFGDRILERTGVAQESLAEVSEAVDSIASYDMTFAIESKDRFESLLPKLKEVERLMRVRIDEAAAVTEEVQRAATAAVVGLQFDDIVSQLLGKIGSRLSRIEEFLKVLADAVDGTEVADTVALDALVAAQHEERVGVREATVSQVTMDAGSVELF